MKKLSVSHISILALIIVTFVLSSSDYEIKTMLSGSGAAPGYTGSPADKQTCTACHSGPTAVNQTSWITSNVPVGGYVPGTIYTITATATRAGHTKFGFEVSPQNVSGNLLGTLISTSSQTKLVGNNKYITHTSTGTSGSGSKTWTFNWTAPTAGTGSVTFYGAFNVTNANNNINGDSIYTSTLVIAENSSVGISDINSAENNILIYPNPVSDKLNIQYSLSKSAHVVIRLVDLQGKICKTLLSETKTVSTYTSSFNIDHNQIAKGIYFIEIKIGNTKRTQKIIIE